MKRTYWLALVPLPFLDIKDMEPWVTFWTQKFHKCSIANLPLGYFQSHSSFNELALNNFHRRQLGLHFHSPHYCILSIMRHLELLGLLSDLWNLISYPVNLIILFANILCHFSIIAFIRCVLGTFLKLKTNIQLLAEQNFFNFHLRSLHPLNILSI